MKKTSRVLALLLAAAMIISLAACGKKQPDIEDQIANTMESVTSDIQSDLQKIADEADASAPADDQKTADAQSGDTAQKADENSDKTSGESGTKKGLDLASASFEYVNPFSEGLAWVIHKNAVKVINKAGEVVFEIKDGKKSEIDQPMPYCDGVSFYNIGKDYYIVDQKGNILYQTKPYSADEYEQILGYGDGNFLVHRYKKAFKTGGDTLGTIDKNGSETSEFYPAETSGKMIWEYVGEGVFCETLSNTLYDTANGKTTSINADVSIVGNETDSVAETPARVVSENGKVWVELQSLHGLGIMDVHTAEIREFNGESNHTYIIDDVGVVDGVYYDLSGGKIADVPLYQENVIRRGKFSSAGYAPLVLLDDGSYMTFVDQSGEEQFEPMLLGAESSFYDDYFATVDPKKTTDVVIYDHTGTEKYRVSGVTDDKDLRLYDDYFIAGKNYYFFK